MHVPHSDHIVGVMREEHRARGSRSANLAKPFMSLARSDNSNSGLRARTRAKSKVAREMVANCSRPVRLIKSMLMPVQIATRANAPHAVAQFEHSKWDGPPP